MKSFESFQIETNKLIPLFSNGLIKEQKHVSCILPFCFSLAHHKSNFVINIRVTAGQVANEQATVADHSKDFVIDLIRGPISKPINPLDFKFRFKLMALVDLFTDPFDDSVMVFSSFFPEWHGYKYSAFAAIDHLVKDFDEISSTGIIYKV